MKKDGVVKQWRSFAVIAMALGSILGCSPLNDKPELNSTSQGITCQATYECPGGYTCTAGTCEWVEDTACTTSCDCPNLTTCYAGRCQVDFSPFPECHCDNHCAAHEVCIGRGCEPGPGPGGGGGGGGGGFEPSTP